MNEKNKFSLPTEMDYNEIVLPYQKAFMGDPWYEVSKCADGGRVKRCAGGLSKLAVGELCFVCGDRPSRPAYEDNELNSKFVEIGASRPTLWYTESTQKGIALAAFTWVATADVIANERYGDVREMDEWLNGALGSEEEGFIWLDEIFANKEIRPTGNLRNFKSMTEGFMEQFGLSVMAFRTINPALVRAAQRDFGEEATVFKRNEAVPDRRDFVLIRKEEE